MSGIAAALVVFVFTFLAGALVGLLLPVAPWPLELAAVLGVGSAGLLALLAAAGGPET